MKNVPLNIEDFVRRSDVLNEKALSDTQMAILKSIYGRPLNDREREIYCRLTGRPTYEVGKEQREATIIAGRRGGKTTIAAIIALFEAFRDHGLRPGETAYIMLLALTLGQARIALKYIRKYLRNSPILSKHILDITKDEITLDNNIVIACYACTHDSVRGRTVIAIICDEIGFWPFDEDAANPADEVLTALRPSMATVRNAKLIKISTPYTKSGVLWEDFQRRRELDYPVWQVSTFEMNPTLTPEMVESERQRCEEKYLREYLAQFTDAVNGWIVPEILDPCIVPGRRELPYHRDMNYVAAIDPAGRKNDFALAIVHRLPDGTVVTDKVERWTGTKNFPLPFQSVLGQIKQILESYGINSVTGDQYYCDAIGEHLLKLGILYKVSNFSSQTRGRLFMQLKHLLSQRKIELVDDVELLRELRNLREEKTPRGQIDVRPTIGNDDTAVALALAVNEAITQESPLPFEVVPVDCRPSRAPLHLDPENCLYAAPCENHPNCLTAGHCLGFKSKSVGVPLTRISF
jgi:hypothetical protein